MTPMAKLSLVVITRNEEQTLEGCLGSVPFADEIVIVDDNSTDATREVAVRHGAQFLSRTLDRFGLQKQFAIEQATGDWLLLLDADERLNGELAAAIQVALETDSPFVDGYLVRRLTTLFGREVRYSGWYKLAHLRLFRRGRARFDDRRVHEFAVLDDSSRSAVLSGHVDHHTGDDAAVFRAKSERYARLAAEDWYDMGRRVTLSKVPYYLLLRPAVAFLKRFVGQQGFRDGAVGLQVARMRASADYATARALRRLTRARGH